MEIHVKEDPFAVGDAPSVALRKEIDGKEFVLMVEFPSWEKAKESVEKLLAILNSRLEAAGASDVSTPPWA